MKSQLAYLLYGVGYWVRTKLLRQSIPFIGGLVINETCNLHCVQCKVANRDLPDLTYNDVRHGLLTFYRMGIRSVFVEGGEPFLWKDGDYKLEDVVQAAREIGFAVVSIYTNGTLPIRISADTVFVSLDGLRTTNDRLRGKIYDRVMSNILESQCPNICINFTINTYNQHEIEAFCQEIQTIPAIKGVFFYFHTPYYGRDELFLELDERRKIIDRIQELKRRKLKILNSRACLNAVHKDTWERPSRLCYVYANKSLFKCCRAIGNDDVCRDCGYLGYPEIIQILKLRPSAILSAFRYLPRNTPKFEYYD